MKKVLLLLMTTLSLTVWADGRDRYREEMERRPHPDAQWHSDLGWVIPALVGGALVYQATQRPAEAAPTYYPIQAQQPQSPPYGYHWEQIIDAQCNCQRVVLVRD